MNLSPVLGDIAGAGTASNQKDGRSAAEPDLESQVFAEIVRDQARVAERTTALLAQESHQTAGQQQRDKAQQLRESRRKPTPQSLVDGALQPVTTGVAGGTPTSPADEASKALATPPSANDHPNQHGERLAPSGRNGTAEITAATQSGAERSSAPDAALPGRSPSQDSQQLGTRSPDRNVPAPLSQNQSNMNSQSSTSVEPTVNRGTQSEASRTRSITSPGISRQLGPSPVASNPRALSDTALRSLLGPPGRANANDRNTPGKLPVAGSSRPATFVDQPPEAQIARGLAQVLRQRGGSVTLKLNPEALGEVRVQLELHGSNVAATLRASNDTARETLSKTSDTLRKSLESHGLHVTELRVVGPEPTSNSESANASSQNGVGADTTASNRHGEAGSRHPSDRGNAASFGAPNAEKNVPDTSTDFGWAMVGGRLVIDTVA